MLTVTLSHGPFISAKPIIATMAIRMPAKHFLNTDIISLSLSNCLHTALCHKRVDYTDLFTIKVYSRLAALT